MQAVYACISYRYNIKKCQQEPSPVTRIYDYIKRYYSNLEKNVVIQNHKQSLSQLLTDTIIVHNRKRCQWGHNYDGVNP